MPKTWPVYVDFATKFLCLPLDNTCLLLIPTGSQQQINVCSKYHFNQCEISATIHTAV